MAPGTRIGWKCVNEPKLICFPGRLTAPGFLFEW